MCPATAPDRHPGQPAGKPIRPSRPARLAMKEPSSPGQQAGKPARPTTPASQARRTQVSMHPSEIAHLTSRPASWQHSQDHTSQPGKASKAKAFRSQALHSSQTQRDQPAITARQLNRLDSSSIQHNIGVPWQSRNLTASRIISQQGHTRQTSQANRTKPAGCSSVSARVANQISFRFRPRIHSSKVKVIQNEEFPVCA